MFGYVVPFKPDLKMRDFELYRSVYCGLCKQLGKKYTPIARLFLSYDMTFLALCALSLKKEPAQVGKKICMAHPTRKKCCHLNSEEISFAADAAMIFSYFSCKDHLCDRTHLILCLLSLPFLYFACKKAKKRRPDIYAIIDKMIKGQTQLEKMRIKSMDQAADPTARALGNISASFASEEKSQPVLYRFGYMLGRYIYLIDGLDDMQKDAKKGCYNPFLMRYPEETMEYRQEKAQEALRQTVAQLAGAYELLTIHQYKPILDNIIYQGLPYTIKRVVMRKKEEKTEGGLS